MHPRIYVYKITFLEVPYYYYGVHKEKYFNEEYWGSPITHKWVWDFYTPKKQILQFFDFTDEGWLEAQSIERRLIKPAYNTDRFCLNEHCGGNFSLEICSNAGKKAKELGLGVHGRTKEQMSENGRKTKELGIGVHGRTKKQIKKDSKIGGKRTKERGVGIFGLTTEQTSENGKKGGKIGGKKVKELCVGIHGRTKEQIKKDSEIGGKKTSSQKWKCTETGYISTPGPLTHYQNKRGIDTSNRIRIK
jgi:hypothetical protein